MADTIIVKFMNNEKYVENYSKKENIDGIINYSFYILTDKINPIVLYHFTYYNEEYIRYKKVKSSNYKILDLEFFSNKTFFKSRFKNNDVFFIMIDNKKKLRRVNFLITMFIE